MRIILAAIVAVALVGLSSCSKFISYDGPEVTRIVVMKSERKMYLFHGDEVLKSYDIDLGFAPVGHKQFRGDGKTPEGRYYIDRKNPNSAYYLSLGISYPNEQDRAFAAAQGKSPGGDIFIHGARKRGNPRGPDWTAGCISVKNHEVREIYAMVRIGTVIDIFE